MGENALFPTIEVPELVSKTDRCIETYKPSLTWDIEKGDFVRNGTNQLVACNAMDAYKVWCYKTVKTERFACLAYTDELGTEMESALKEKSNEAIDLAVERTITEALLVNPRTEFIRQFAFEWNGDVLRCNFTVKAIEMEEFPLSVSIGGRKGEG